MHSGTSDAVVMTELHQHLFGLMSLEGTRPHQNDPRQSDHELSMKLALRVPF